MKVEISVAEVVQVIKELREQPGKILEIVRVDVPKAVGEYLSEIGIGTRQRSASMGSWCW